MPYWLALIVNAFIVSLIVFGLTAVLALLAIQGQ